MPVQKSACGMVGNMDTPESFATPEMETFWVAVATVATRSN